MILADKIINLRKKNGWSQEELAEKLGVSRQSISKYESAQSVPDLGKILKMGELFGVTTDYLLKDEMEEEEYSEEIGMAEEGEQIHKVTLEMAQDYLKKKENSAKMVALGVMLCILSPISLIVLSIASEVHAFTIAENAATGIGLTILILMVAIAVVFFIYSGSDLKKYEFIEKEKLDTEYGVSGMIKEKKEQFHDMYVKCNIIGVSLCICSVIPLFVCMAVTKNEFAMTCMVGLLLLIVSLGVYCLVFAGTRISALNQLLQEGEYSRQMKEKKRKTAPFAAAYWTIATAIYLAYSFITNDWGRSWIIWPVVGVLSPVYYMIVNALVDKK